MTLQSTRFPSLRRLGAAGLLVVALAATGCQAQGSSTATAPEQAAAQAQLVALRTPRLASVDNFRDLAGLDAPYAVTGGHLRAETVYRSNALELSDADLATIENLGITQVIDLRTPSEIQQHPDRVPAGANYVNIDILGGGTTAANPNADFKVDSAAGAATMLEQLNRGFVEDPGMRGQFAKVLTTVAEADGPVLFHCTAGKDRAGWTAAILQLTAGASEQDVMANYLATNDYSAQRIQATTEQIRAAKGEQAAEAYQVLLGVQPSFLQTGLDAMKAQYGDVDGYLSKGLGLDAATIEKLKKKLVTA